MTIIVWSVLGEWTLFGENLIFVTFCHFLILLISSPFSNCPFASQFETVGDMQVYITGTGQRAILAIPDIFAFQDSIPQAPTPPPNPPLSCPASEL